MKRISSPSTFVYKKLLPAIWFSSLIFGAVMMLWNKGGGFDDLWVFLLAIGVATAVGTFMFRKLFQGLADQVHDLGDALLVRKSDEEERIPLVNIMNVSVTSMVNPPRVTLRLIKPSRFGNEIAFLPRAKLVFIPIARNAVAEDLILRVHEAKMRPKR